MLKIIHNLVRKPFVARFFQAFFPVSTERFMYALWSTPRPIYSLALLLHLNNSTTIEHPLFPLFCHHPLDGMINPDVHWLTEPSAATWNIWTLMLRLWIQFTIDPIMRIWYSSKITGEQYPNSLCFSKELEQGQSKGSSLFLPSMPLVDRHRSSFLEEFAIPSVQFGHPFALKNEQGLEQLATTRDDCSKCCLLNFRSRWPGMDGFCALLF